MIAAHRAALGRLTGRGDWTVVQVGSSTDSTYPGSGTSESARSRHAAVTRSPRGRQPGSAGSSRRTASGPPGEDDPVGEERALRSADLDVVARDVDTGHFDLCAKVEVVGQRVGELVPPPVQVAHTTSRRDLHLGERGLRAEGLGVGGVGAEPDERTD